MSFSFEATGNFRIFLSHINWLLIKFMILSLIRLLFGSKKKKVKHVSIMKFCLSDRR